MSQAWRPWRSYAVLHIWKYAAADVAEVPSQVA
jgi:3-methyladenine DNA glycosylase/8-oxoguanine DNA glycosylase